MRPGDHEQTAARQRHPESLKMRDVHRWTIAAVCAVLSLLLHAMLMQAVLLLVQALTSAARQK